MNVPALPPGTHESHVSRREYGDVAAALADARAVVSDIIDQLEPKLFVSCKDLEFLARRARALIDACQRAVDESAAS